MIYFRRRNPIIYTLKLEKEGMFNINPKFKKTLKG